MIQYNYIPDFGNMFLCADRTSSIRQEYNSVVHNTRLEINSYKFWTPKQICSCYCSETKYESSGEVPDFMT